VKRSLRVFTDPQAVSDAQYKLGVLQVSLLGACKFAAYNDLDAFVIDAGGGFGYSMSYTDMIDLLSGRAPAGDNKVIQFAEVSIVYGTPESPPPAKLLEEIRDLANEHQVEQLSWCSAACGEAPAQLCFFFQPFPNDTFAAALRDMVLIHYRGKMTFTTYDVDSRRPGISSEVLKSVLP
jgi:hypothetical protein